jgi:hypothetical protein
MVLKALERSIPACFQVSSRFVGLTLQLPKNRSPVYFGIARQMTGEGGLSRRSCMDSSNTQPPTRPSPPWSVATRSATFYALGLLILANMVISIVRPFDKADPEALPAAKSWVYWATQEFLQKKEHPQVVMIGSSLVMNATWLQEAAHLNKDVDIVANHRTTYLESVIKKYLPGFDQQCYNFGLPGSMASDDYMVIRSLFHGRKKPAIAVIGLGPRDLMDCRFNCAASSKHFQYLERYSDTHDIVNLTMPQFWQRVNFVVKELDYFVGKKWNIQIATGELVRNLCQPALALISKEGPLEFSNESNYRLEIAKGVWIAHPSQASYFFLDNTSEWKRRHRRTNDDLFNNQAKFVDMALQLCRKEGIEPLLLNMPIMKASKDAMHPAIYPRHVALLQSLAQKYNCVYVDTNEQADFVPTDFTDTCHMDASGGEKLLNIVG